LQMIKHLEVHVLKKVPVPVGIEVGKAALARHVSQDMWDRLPKVLCSPVEMSRSDCAPAN
jgi:hypothetical protein